MRRAILLLLVFVFFPISVKAADEFVTIVNPVRISTYNQNPVASIKAQYEIIKKLNLPATWLVTYDVLENPEMVANLKNFNSKQEIGLFLEVSKNSANKSGILYHETGSWHFANAVLLSGYTQEERIKYLDMVFGKYKSLFGVYPKSVGSWWTDSFSLSYIHNKYGVIADLGCSDQFGTDNYFLWGQFWSTPYYPNKNHVGIPASSLQNKLDVVRLLWAPRDPDLGYDSSLYSTQDYFTLPKLDINYFKKLVDLYAGKHSNQFGQITVGLEGDFGPKDYMGNFLPQMEYLSQNKYQKTTMKDFANYYQSRFSQLSPSHEIKGESTTWYMSPYYRIGFKSGKIIDLRSYASYFEPHYQRPNRENTLYINILSEIDQKSDQSSEWNIGEGNIQYFDRYFEVRVPLSKPPKSLLSSKLFKVTKMADGYRVEVNTQSLNDRVVTYWTPESLNSFRSKKFWTWKFEMNKYLVSVDETEALKHISGRILVYDHTCLQCEYHTALKPAAYVDAKSYMSSAILNKDLFEQKLLTESVKQFKKLNIDYVYLRKYEDFIEKIPFSPGDWNLEKIYENANAVVYRVVK